MRAEFINSVNTACWMMLMMMLMVLLPTLLTLCVYDVVYIYASGKCVCACKSSIIFVNSSVKYSYSEWGYNFDYTNFAGVKWLCLYDGALVSLCGTGSVCLCCAWNPLTVFLCIEVLNSVRNRTSSTHASRQPTFTTLLWMWMWIIFCR